MRDLLIVLRLDDFEDQSPLRRGQPSTHSIFGAAQTVNSANFQIIAAMADVQRLSNLSCLTIFTGE
jgi:geranylgeranyl pyrophosphate synthase